MSTSMPRASLVTGEDGTFGYDVTDPLNPLLPYRSDPSIVNTGGGRPGAGGSGPLDFLHHNMLRTSLVMDDAGEVTRRNARHRQRVAITEEDYAKPACEGQGSCRRGGSPGREPGWAVELELLDTWTTELNELTNQNGRSPATGNCSAHWFDESDGLVAQGRYEQGVRFLDVTNPRESSRSATTRPRGRSGRRTSLRATARRSTRWTRRRASTC